MKKILLAALVIAVLLLGLVGTAVAASPAGNPGKGPIDKVVFVHYPKDAPGKPLPGGRDPRGVLSGVLSPDYSYSGYRWADPTAVKYWVNPSGSGVNTTTTLTAVQAAFATWDNADGPLGYSYQSTTTLGGGGYNGGVNVVSWANISAQYPNAIAVTFIWIYRYTRQIAEVDTEMNSALPWSYTAPNVTHDLSTQASANISRYTDPTNSGAPGAYDIRDIMTHEAGHWIMLGDLYSSRDSLLTMYGYGATGEISKDTLGYGDERGVEAVYGP
jgi:hypothetical protein